jgi:BBSome-interacting protein 1
MDKRDWIPEVTPKAGLVFSERGLLTGVMCKPKIMPIKSMTLEQIEEMEKKLLEQLSKK